VPDPTSRDPQTDANRRQRSSRLQALVRNRWFDRGGMSSLAKTIGVSRATLYSWLRGDTVPDLDTMSRLADALGLTPSELLALVGEGEPIDAVSELPMRSMLALPEDPLTMNAWDPAWIPPSRAQVAKVSHPGETRRLSSPSRHVRLLDLLVGSEVMTADADEPIGPVVERMYERAYSQVPAYRGRNLVGLLTNDAVARWMGSVRSRPGRSTDRATVAEVLGTAEAGHPFEIVGHDATVHNALALFDAAMNDGTPLAAVIVTQDGAATGRPLGILTTSDLPRLRVYVD
jgi:predicted transcriptional regulator/transcriptional regulator with XRE-family HTH domain